METAVCVSGFVLLIFITDVHLSPDPEPVIGHEGGDAKFKTSFDVLYDEDEPVVLYRIREDGDLLLINCSQPETPQPDGYEVKCVYFCISVCTSYLHVHFEMYNLSMSQSGDYRAEGWRGGNITGQTSFRLTVCAEVGQAFSEVSAFGHILCKMNSTLGQGRSLQLYQGDWWSRWTLVLDTNSSLEPLVEDLRGRLQVDLNTSQVTLSGFTNHTFRFCCTVWRGSQCQMHTYSLAPPYLFVLYATEDENVAIPCILRVEFPGHVHWSTPTGLVQLRINQTHPQEVMYMLNGSQAGNHSLIIPSVSPQHSGRYECRGRGLIKTTELYICIKSPPPTDVMFSHGESVWLGTVHFNTTKLRRLQWYRQKALQPQVLIANYWNKVKLVPEDLRGRVTELRTSSNHSLIISNLTAEDSGVYTWRVHKERYNSCYEGSIRLVYRDPFGVHSPFYRAYAPLIGCVLLGLVAAVIWFKLRSRRGEQTSGPQSREGQQSGDGDLYDEVEMVELNT